MINHSQNPYEGQPWYEKQKDELGRQSEQFWARVERDTPLHRKAFEVGVVGGVQIVEVGDLVWWPQTDATLILGAVRLADGRCLALGYDGENFEEPEASKFSWALKNLTELPRLKLDDGYIGVWFGEERYMMAEHGCPNEEYQQGRTPRYRWRYTGIGSSGATALRAFAKHGMTFSADFTPAAPTPSHPTGPRIPLKERLSGSGGDNRQSDPDGSDGGDGD